MPGPSSVSSRTPASKWTAASGSGAQSRFGRGLVASILGKTPGVLVYLLLVASLIMNSLWVSGRLRIHGLPGSERSAQLLTEASSCGATNVDALRAHLSDVILVINIRKQSVANEAVVSMLRGIYNRMFDTIVFLGQKEDPKLGIEVRSTLPWAKNGSYSYFFFPRLVARHTKAAGFLWIDDDVQLNYWQLLSANKSKLWLAESPTCCVCDCKKLIPFDGGQPSDCGDPQYVRDSAKLALERLEGNFQEAYNRSIGEQTYGYPSRRANVFYVPRRLSIALAFDLSPVFRDVGVVQEAAVPMMFRCLEVPGSFDPVLNNLACWEGKEEAAPEVEWQSTSAGLYPWSMASVESRNHLLETLRRHDTCVQRPAVLEQ